jgi:hypothetical protein
MRTLLAMTFATGFLAAAAFAFPACGSSSPGPDGGTGGSAGSGGSKGSGSGGSTGSGSGGSHGSGSGGSAGSPSDGGTCAEAGALIPLPACVSCLTTNCGSTLTACLCNTACIGIVECTVACVADGGAGSSCAPTCAGDTDSSTAGSDALLLLECLEGKCEGSDGSADPCAAPAPDSGADTGAK